MQPPAMRWVGDNIVRLLDPSPEVLEELISKQSGLCHPTPPLYNSLPDFPYGTAKCFGRVKFFYLNFTREAHEIKIWKNIASALWCSISYLNEMFQMVPGECTWMNNQDASGFVMFTLNIIYI